jgi:hypothetical protein
MARAKIRIEGVWYADDVVFPSQILARRDAELRGFAPDDVQTEDA